MRSFLRSAVLAGSALSLGLALAGCEDGTKTATPEVKDGGMAPGPAKKDAMEPPKEGMEPAKPPVTEPEKPAAEAPKGDVAPETKPADVPK